MSADPEHIDLLRRGPRPWNEWRAQNPTITPNLAGIALSIGDRQLGPINGGPVNLSHARLRNAVLRFATLTDTVVAANRVHVNGTLGMRLEEESSGNLLRANRVSRSGTDGIVPTLSELVALRGVAS